MITNRIIVVGAPNPRLSQLKTLLESQGHQVAEVASPVRAIAETTGGLHDVLILDSRMGGVCEYDVCRTIRPKSDLGIILLIRDDAEQTRVAALDAGADDYLAEPFLPAELFARIRALLRRVSNAGARKAKLVLSDRVIDLQSHEILGPGNRVSHLTPKEFNALQFLMSHPNTAVSHHSLARAVWSRSGGDFEYLRIVIGQLRRKLEPHPEAPRYIVTDRSLGYRFQFPENVIVPEARTDIPATVQ